MLSYLRIFYFGACVLVGALLVPLPASALTITSLNASPTATVNYTLYDLSPPVEAFIQLRDPGDLGIVKATDNLGNAVSILLTFGDSPTRVTPLFGNDCSSKCRQGLNGTGTLDVFNIATGADELSGTFTGGAIYGTPGEGSADIDLNLNVAPAYGGGSYFFRMMGSTTAPLALCDITIGSPVCRRDSGYDASKIQYFSSFTLDWTATITQTPFSPITPVPEPSSLMLMLAGLIGIGKYSTGRGKLRTRSVT